MDFHSLPRRELQTLCKKNKIPANLSNIAMADALQALETVEGIQELLLKPSESSIESPAKSDLTSLSVPRTAAGTTTRRQTVQDESETSQNLTRTRRSTRRLVAGDGDQGHNSVAQTPAAAIGNRGRRALAASACRKMETQFKEIEEDDYKIVKEEEKISETPSMVLGIKGDTTFRQVYTRRSARLAGKNVEDLMNIKEKEISETVKTELFSISNAFGEECYADAETVTEGSVTGIEMKEKSEQELDGSTDKEVVSGSKSDCSVDNPNNSQVGFDEDSGDHVEIVESKLTEENDGGEGDTSNNGSDDGYSSKFEDALENGQELDTNALNINDEVVENNESGDCELFPKTEDQDTGIIPGVDLMVETSNSSEEEAFANDLAERSSSMELNTSAAHQDKIIASLESEISWVEGADFQWKIPSIAEEGELRKNISEDNAEVGPDHSVTLKQLVECEYKETLTPLFVAANVTGDISILSCLATDFNDDISSVRGGTDLTPHAVVPTGLTPVKGAPIPRKNPLKKSVSKTPSAAKTMITQVLDDKENIDNCGTKLFLTKEKKEERASCEQNPQKPYVEQSLRELKKILKGKLELTKEIDNDEKINTEVVTTRPALQALPENRLVGDS